MWTLAFVGPGSIGDRVWYDLDRDGTDAGEPGIFNVTVTERWFGFDGIEGNGDDVAQSTSDRLARQLRLRGPAAGRATG